MLAQKLIHRRARQPGFGCINRCSRRAVVLRFNNLLADCEQRQPGAPKIDFAAHGRPRSAHAQKTSTTSRNGSCSGRARHADRTSVICFEPIRLAPRQTVARVGSAVPEVSSRPKVQAARQEYDKDKL